MIKNPYWQWIALTALSAPSWSIASTSNSETAISAPTSVAQTAPTLSTTIPDHGYRLHANLGAGFGSLLGGQYQASPSGAYSMASIGLGRRTPRWEWDTHLGWGVANRSGQDSNGNPVTIQIRSARADLSPRYRLTPSWSIGPIVTAHFGTDTRFNTSISNSIATIYGGAKTALDIGAVKSFPIQAWGEALTELSSLGRDAVTLIAGIRLSLPLSERQNDVVVVSQAAPRRDIRIVLDSRKVFFKTNSARLKPEVLQTLHQVSRHLAENQENWSFIEIAGHADLRGPKDYNDRLSRRRAEAVERAMATADSLDKSRIQLASYGYSRPADPRTTRNAFARNRRVELTFRDVAHPEQLEALLAALSPEPPIAR